MRLVFIDTETTGLDKVKDRVVEIAVVTVDYHTLSVIGEVSFRINPEIPIPLEASNIHNITDDLVKDCAPFKIIANLLQKLLNEATVIGGQNVDFDIEIINRQLVECGEKGIPININTIDTLLIEKLINSHKLSEMYKRYTGKELLSAHSALTDVKACIEVLKHQRLKLSNNSDLSFDIKQSLGYDIINYLDHSKCFYKDEKDNKIKLAFGKFKGTEASLCINYLNWICNNNFSGETKAIAQKIINEQSVKT